jgi:hypothetical protein
MSHESERVTIVSMTVRKTAHAGDTVTCHWREGREPYLTIRHRPWIVRLFSRRFP